MSVRFNKALQTTMMLSAFGAILTFTAPTQAQLPQVSVYSGRVPFTAATSPASCPLTTGVSKISRDLAGDIFVLVIGGTTTSCIAEIPVSGPIQTIVPPTDPSMSTAAPTSMTSDPSGNLYVVHSSDVISYIPRNANGTYTLASETNTATFGGQAVTNGYYTSPDIAVDSLGNIYAASSGGNVYAAGTSNQYIPTFWTGKGILMYGPSTGNTAKFLVSATNSKYPYTIQVDAAGDVFYADSGNVYEITAATVAATIGAGTPIATGTAIATGNVPLSSSAITGSAAPMTTPKYLYQDPAGNLYVGNGTNADYVIVNNTGFTAASAVYFLPGNYYTGTANGTNGPIIGKGNYTYGAVDNQGNLYLTYGALEFYGGGREYMVANSTAPYANSFPGEIAVGGTGSSTATASGSALGLLFSSTTTLSTSSPLPFVTNASGSAFGGTGTAEVTYNSASGSTTCVAGTTYSAGQSCLVEIGYKNYYPGFFATGVNVYTTGGTLITTINANGIGTGPTATVDTGVVTSIGTGLSSPLGVAVDNTGAMYVADPGAGKVLKFAAGSSAPGTLVGSFTTPSGVAIDAGGNVFVADTGTNTVSYFPNNNGTLGGQVTLTTTGYTLNTPRGVAIDSFGNLYVADTGNNRVLLVPNPLIGAVGKIVTVGSGFTSPYGIAVDAFNNVYVADKGAGKVYEVAGGYNTATPATSNVGNVAVTTVGSFTSPIGVAVDGSGTVYVTDSSLAQVVKVPYTGAAFGTQSALFTAAATGLSAPAGIAIDRTGDLYFTDSDQPGLYFAQRSEASGSAKIALPLPDATSTTSTTTGVILSNAGLTTALTESAAITPAASYSISTNGCNGTSLNAGASCTDVVSFAGSSASAADTNVAGTLTFTDNQLNVASQTAPVTLSAIATGGIANVAISGDASVTYGADETYTVKALDSGGKPSAAAVNGNYTVTVTANTMGDTGTSASVTLNGGTGSFTLPTANVNVGNYTLTTTVGGTASNSLAITVNKAPLLAMATNVSRVFDTPNPTLTVTYIGLANSDTSSVVGGTPAITTTALRTSPAGTYPVSITGALSATNYTITENSGTLSVTGSSPQVILFDPLPGFTGASTVTLTGTSTSGLPLTYIASAGSISGNVLTVPATGTAVTVTAVQTGNTSYAPATSVSRSFTAQ